MYTLSKNMMLSLKQISFLYRNICSIANTKYFLAQCLFLILKILLAIYIYIYPSIFITISPSFGVRCLYYLIIIRFTLQNNFNVFIAAFKSWSIQPIVTSIRRYRDLDSRHFIPVDLTACRSASSRRFRDSHASH